MNGRQMKLMHYKRDNIMNCDPWDYPMTTETYQF